MLEVQNQDFFFAKEVGYIYCQNSINYYYLMSK
jgi:hypothetical protein